MPTQADWTVTAHSQDLSQQIGCCFHCQTVSHVVSCLVLKLELVYWKPATRGDQAPVDVTWLTDLMHLTCGGQYPHGSGEQPCDGGRWPDGSGQQPCGGGQRLCDGGHQPRGGGQQLPDWIQKPSESNLHMSGSGKQMSGSPDAAVTQPSHFCQLGRHHD